jgi:hypothetical protein
MLHPPKLLIHHNYKGILYYYKNFLITIGNLIPLHVIQHIISLLLLFHYLNAIHKFLQT